MRKFGIVLVLIAVICFIGCGVFASQSFDKYTNYYSSENYYILNRNAYVGGDAYNYIINGTYFTALAVYAVGLGLAGILSLGLSGLLIGLSSRLHANAPARPQITVAQEPQRLDPAAASAVPEPANPVTP